MLIEHLRRQSLEREAQSLRRHRRVAETPCSPRQTVSLGDGPARELLAFCSNDYLGLAAHPTLVEALAEGAALYGAGSGASHLISGHSRAHQALEEDLADWLSPHIPGGRALSFCTGYLANLALLTTLGDASATLFCDKLNHASLIDGARLSKAAVQRYPHRQLERLDSLLAQCATPVKLILTDAVFSMDGDLADLPALLTLAERHDAWLIVDDAHGLGVLGEQGRGSLAHFGLRSERFVLMGTLGKAAGVGGAFVAAHPAVIDALVQTARSYIYTTAAPPALAHAVRASVRLMRGAEGDQRRARVAQRVAELRRQLAAVIAAREAIFGKVTSGGPAASGAPWRLADSLTAIQPLVIGDNADALALSAALDEQGLWVPAIRPPTVPAGTARLRITLSAAHTADDVLRLTQALAHAAQDAPARPASGGSR